jgi:luciferase family oxidoreductase group 1
MSLLEQSGGDAPDFADQVADILAMLDGTYVLDGVRTDVTPSSRGNALRPWVFGSSKGQSAQVAATFGLPFVASYHITPATALEAVDAYRNAFVPSDALAQPYVVVSADVVAADDTATARHLASTYGNWVYAIRSRDGAEPYPDPDRAGPLTETEYEVVKDRVATQFVGDADEVAHRLDALQRATDADELVITSVTHRHQDRLRSHQLVAKSWGL